MPISQYNFIYGCVVPYEEIWNFFHPNEKAEQDKKEENKNYNCLQDKNYISTDTRHDWVLEFLDAKALKPIRGSLSKSEKELREKCKDSVFFRPRNNVVAINLPHDQVQTFDEGEGNYVVIGLLTPPAEAILEFSNFVLEGDRDAYHIFRKELKGTNLYPLLKSPRLLCVQDDCRCCT